MSTSVPFQSLLGGWVFTLVFFNFLPEMYLIFTYLILSRIYLNRVLFFNENPFLNGCRFNGGLC